MKKLAIVLLMAAAGLSGKAMAADKPSVLVVLAPGFEEGETVEILDVVRCGGFPTDSVSIAGEMVPGAHNITIKADKVLGNELTQFKNYDMIVLPEGWTGVDNMLADERLLDLVRHYDQSGKFVAAMCAAPKVLAKADILKGKTMTAYPGKHTEPNYIDANYVKDVVVKKKKLVKTGDAALYKCFSFHYEINYS